MKFFNHLHSVLLILSLFSLSACGQKSNTATLTLVTGLEKNHSTNLMDEITGRIHSLFSNVTATCVQPELYAVYQVQNSNQSNSFPIHLSTPADIDAGTYGIDSNGGVSAWLSSSTLDPINLPVPMGVPIDVGVKGYLIASLNVAGDGTCPPISGSVPNPTYSLLGQTTVTLSGDTSIPLNLWATHATPSGIIQYPSTPPSNSVCANVFGEGYAQQCANLNFDLLTIGCPAGSNCATNGSFVQFDYGYSVNGPQYISQLVPIASATAGGVEIPATSPVTVTILNSSLSPIEKNTYDVLSDSDTPYFSTGADIFDSAYLSFTLGSGTTTIPDHFLIVGPSNLTAGTCASYKITIVDANGVPAVVNNTIAYITLSHSSSNATFSLGSDASCTSAASGTQDLAKGNHTLFLNYKDTTPESASVTFSSASVPTAASFQITTH